MIKFEYYLLSRNYKRFVLRFKKGKPDELHLTGHTFHYSTMGDSCSYYIPSEIVDILGIIDGKIILDNTYKKELFKSNYISFTISFSVNPILRLYHPLPRINLIYKDGMCRSDMQTDIDILIRALNEFDNEEIYNCIKDKSKFLQMYIDKPMYDLSNMTYERTMDYLPLSKKIRIKIRIALAKIKTLILKKTK